jgi:hypothetical protein
MPRNAKVFDVFLSTPSDVFSEKKFAIEIVNEWNATRGRISNVHFQILTWENVVSSSVSDRPQSVINQQIGDSYDMYLGIMWHRFGTPTGVAESGTVEEFDRALDRFRNGENLRLAMLFKTSSDTIDNIDGIQLNKVKEFKERFGNEGGIYNNFKDNDEFRRAFTRILENMAGDNNVNFQKSYHIDELKIEKEGINKDHNDEEDDIGIFEINENLVEVVDKQVVIFQKIQDIAKVNVQVTEKCTAQLSTLASMGQANAESIKPIVEEIANSIDDVAEVHEENMKEFFENNFIINDLTTKSLDVSGDFSGNENEKSNLFVSVRSTIEMLSDYISSSQSMSESVIGIPRMSSHLNKSKKRLKKVVDLYVSDLSNLRDKLSLSIDYYDR